MNKIKTNIDLFWVFFKIGLFTFGGGYAMISLIQAEIVEKKKWLNDSEFMELIAIAESTPGPIAINSATYIGYKQNKIFGSFLATLGVVLPSFLIILLISVFLERFNENNYIKAFLKGVQAGVGVLIFNAGFKLYKKLKFNELNLIFLLIGVYVAFFTNFNLILLLVIFVTISFFYSFGRLNQNE